MTAPVPLLAHGMGLGAVAPDWAPLRTEEVRRLLGRLADVGEASAAAVTWHSPRPFAATAVIKVPGAAGGEGRPLVVKRHHRAVRSEASLRAEHGFMRHLSARGVAVPRALDDGDGSAWAEGDYVYEVLEMLNGQDLYREALSWTPFVSPGHARSAGGALARLHLASEGYAAPARPPEPLRASGDIIGSDDPVGAVAALAGRRAGLADYLGPRSWRRELSRSLRPSRRATCPTPPAWRPCGHTTTGTPRTCCGQGPGRRRRWPGSSTSA